MYLTNDQEQWGSFMSRKMAGICNWWWCWWFLYVIYVGGV